MATKPKAEEPGRKNQKEFQMRLKSPQDRLCYLHDFKLFTDVSFKFIDENQKPHLITGHLAYLAVCSSVFERMWKERSNNWFTEYTVTDVSPSIFSKMLKYLYKSEIAVNEDTEAVLLYEAAHKYKIQSLKMECNEYLMKIRINIDNVVAFLNGAMASNINTLHRKCIEFIEENPQVCEEPEIFLEMSESSVRSVLKMQRLKIESEDIMLKLLVRWTDRHLGTSGVEVFKSLLSYIRFDGLTARDFLYTCKKHKTHFTNSQVLDVLRFMARPEYGLPSWWEPPPVKGKKSTEVALVQRGPVLNVASEYRLIGQSSDVEDVKATKISARICMRCTRLTELVLGVKISVTNVANDTQVKVLLEGNVLEPNKTTPIQCQNYEQQCKFEDNSFNFLFKTPFRLYYDCKLNLEAKLCFPQETLLVLCSHYVPSASLVNEVPETEPKDKSEGKEKDKEYAIFSALFYMPRYRRIRIDNVT